MNWGLGGWGVGGGGGMSLDRKGKLNRIDRLMNRGLGGWGVGGWGGCLWIGREN